jgi:DNA topoisomerase-3
VQETERQDDSPFQSPSANVIGICPHCGSNVIESSKSWHCSSNDCRFILWKDHALFKKIGKKLTEPVAKKLLTNGSVRLAGCVSKKTGKKYNAVLRMSTDDTGKPEFTMEFENKKKSQEAR